MKRILWVLLFFRADLVLAAGHAGVSSTVGTPLTTTILGAASGDKAAQASLVTWVFGLLGTLLGGLFANAAWKELVLLVCKRAALTVEEAVADGRLQAAGEEKVKAAMAWARSQSWGAWLYSDRALQASVQTAVAVLPNLGANVGSTQIVFGPQPASASAPAHVSPAAQPAPQPKP